MPRSAAMLLHDYLDEMADLTNEEFGRLCRMLLRYSISGEEPEPIGNERFFIHRVLSVENMFQERYEETCEKRREAGRLGGLAKATNAKQMVAKGSKAKQRLANLANTNTNTKTNTKTNTSPSKEGEVKRDTSRFTPPSIADVTTYCMENGYDVDADSFVDFYAQQNWKLSNGNKMTDWRAAVRNWHHRDLKRKPPAAGAGKMTQKENDDAMKRLGALMREMEEGYGD